MKSDRWTKLVLALMMMGSFGGFAQAGSPDPPQTVRVAEIWEDPGNIANDDNDSVRVAGVRVNDTVDLQGNRSPGSATVPRGVIDNTLAGNESPRRGRSTLQGGSRLFWGGYSAAVTVTNSPNIDNTVRVLNSENLQGAGTLSNSFLNFTQHSTDAPVGAFPAAYNEQTGSYAYTLFNSSPSTFPVLDLEVVGAFKIGMSNNQNKPAVTTPIGFRFLIQTENTKWYRSNEQSTPNVNLLDDGVFGGPQSATLTAGAREGLMSTYPVAGMTWERVSSPAEVNMAILNNGGEVELGATQADAGPNLSAVTGMGVVASQLSTGKTIGSLPNSIAVIGVIIDSVATVGFTKNSTDIIGAEADVIISKVVLPSALPQAVSVGISIGSGLAIANKDFTSDFGAIAGNAYVGTLVFQPGEVEKSITITLIDDDIHEPSEDIQLQLSDASGAALPTGRDHRTITIPGNDTAPVISIASSLSVDEAVGNALAVLTLSNRSAFPIDLNFATLDGTAVAGLDYTAQAAVFGVNHVGAVINEDILTIPIPIQITDDAFDETDQENFQVTISNPVNASIALGGNVETVSILDNDAPPTVSFTVAAQNVTEGDGSSVNASVNVNLSAPSALPFTVSYATGAGGDTATANVDYTSIPTTVLTFTPNAANPALGETTKSFSATVLGDTLDEPNETFSIVLSNASTNGITTGLITPNGTQVITIDDNDTPPTISLSQATQNVAETAGTATVTINLDKPSGRTIRVSYTFTDIEAEAGFDYSPPGGQMTGTLDFAPGVTSQNVVIGILDNNYFDSRTRTFTFAISGPVNLNGSTNIPPSLGTSSQTITIQEDETPPVITISTGSQNVAEEAGKAVVSVSVVPPSLQAVLVDFTTGGGTATVGQDYTFSAWTLIFSVDNPGPLDVEVPIIDDEDPEPTQSFNFVLSNPINGTLGLPSTQVVAIIDTDAPFISASIFTETWNSVTPQDFAPGLVVNSDQSFVAEGGDSATPLSALRFDSVDGSMRLQRNDFGTGGSRGSESVAIGNSLRAPISPTLDDDAILSLTLEARVFIGQLTPDGTPDYPTPGDENFAPFTTFTFAIGDNSGGDLLSGVPGVLTNDASLAFRLNNFHFRPSGDDSPRLEFAINDADFGLSEALLSVPVAPNTGISAAVDGVGHSLNTTATTSAFFGPGVVSGRSPVQRAVAAIGQLSAGVATPPVVFTAGEEYLVSATFVKQSPLQTDVFYSIRPVDGDAPVDSGGVVQAPSIAAAFPVSRLINEAVINVGSAFGFSATGAGVTAGDPPPPIPGSWVDDLTVRKFGRKKVIPLAARNWELYE